MKFRKIELRDLDMLRSWRNNNSIRCWCRQTGLLSQADQLEWAETQESDPSIEMFVITDEEPLGVCGLTSIDHINRRAEFSLYIGPEHQKEGYGKEALKKLVNYGFQELNLRLIWGESFEGNPAIEMFKSLGFKHEGSRKDFYYKNGKYLDAHIYTVFKKDWQWKDGYTL